jgi:L-amino acid N-acyltransferase YncA
VGSAGAAGLGGRRRARGPLGHVLALLVAGLLDPAYPTPMERAALMATPPITLRPALEADLIAINDIYNYYVLYSTCTYQEEPEPIEGRRQWFSLHGARHPVIVAESARGVVGWGSLSSFHPRSAYRNTVENSVYVAHDCHRQGIGSRLLEDLIGRARDIGHRAIIAGIDAEQSASVALHARFNFEQVGYFRQVGFKFGRWLDVLYMELLL